ncbi:DUF1254 domain-containing protein [Rhodococcus kronopolitis]|uniref:DUF1254 domain-containing protein n=1 Tax=Rhodococcus kronopolitis TaxID=1460226 RepID=A0ABV9FXH2_9NOCA
MRRRGVLLAAPVLLVAGLLGGCAPSASEPSAPDPVDVAADGYVYGAAPVTLARTRANMTCLLPVNQLYSQAQLSGPDSRTVVAPNVDTLYSIAWLDLRAGPVLLSHPDMGERYFGFQFLDIYTNVFANVGTRETGAAAGARLIVPPGFSGPPPPGVAVIESPTWDAWMIGRTLVESDADLPAAREVQQRYEMRVVGPPVSDAPPPLPPTDCGNNPAPQALAASGPEFFDELSAVLASNPPPPADRPLLDRIAALGVTPGGTPSAGELAAVTALESGMTLGESRIEAATQTGGAGWRTLPDAGRYGVDYLQRAVVARIGLGANVPEESAYSVTRTDADGEPLRGDRGYRLHFPAGGLPPVDPRGFWSVTLYGPDMFFVPNALQRYAIGDRTPGLVRNPDGSLDLWIGAAEPGAGRSNWLPAPAGEFVLMLRSYLPTAPSWTPPDPEPRPEG